MRPDIQLEALTDILHLSDNPSKHDILFDVSAVDALAEIVRGPNPCNEHRSKDDQELEVPHPARQGRKGSQDLDYIEEKEIERRKILQVREDMIACSFMSSVRDKSALRCFPICTSSCAGKKMDPIKSRLRKSVGSIIQHSGKTLKRKQV